MVENQGQIFKPDFNNQGLDNNKLQINAQDNQQGLNNDHDNRILNEGPVNLQVGGGEVVSTVKIVQNK